MTLVAVAVALGPRTHIAVDAQRDLLLVWPEDTEGVNAALVLEGLSSRRQQGCSIAAQR